MADPWEWEESDLLGLIDRKAEESLELDFKRCDSLDISTGETRRRAKEKASKHVSAFANAAGGTILYGMKEKNHVAAELDDGYDPNVVTKEWIEQVINANVHPPVPGIRVKTIQLKKNRPGRVAYVVSIPQGTTAHQASDKRYYRRRGTEGLAMDDYEIRDVMQRTGAPNLEIQTKVDGKVKGQTVFQSLTDDGIESPEITITARNDGAAGIAEYSQHQIFFSTTLQPTTRIVNPVVDRTQMRSGTKVSIGSGHLAYAYYEFSFSRSEMPWFPDEERHLLSLTVRLPASPGARYDFPYPWILWRIRAANATERVGAVVFSKILSDVWDFEPASIEDLQEKGMTVEFAP